MVTLLDADGGWGRDGPSGVTLLDADGGWRGEVAFSRKKNSWKLRLSMGLPERRSSMRNFD